MTEKTLVIVKPEAFGAGLVGEIIAWLERAGLKLVAARLTRVSPRVAERLYPDSEGQLRGMGEKTLRAMREGGRAGEIAGIFGTEDPLQIGRTLNQWNRRHICSGPVLGVVVEGDGAVRRVRELIGGTDPSKAAKGTVRGDLATDSIASANRERRATRNIVHAADSAERAGEEIALLFGGGAGV